MRLWPILRRWN